jgi:hypothetical protein
MTNVRSAQERPPMPTMLLAGKGYFIDLEARLFRETMAPGRYVDFDSAKGQELCEQAGIVTCLRCGASVVVSAALRGAPLRCVRCGTAVEQRESSRRQVVSGGSEVR